MDLDTFFAQQRHRIAASTDSEAQIRKSRFANCKGQVPTGERGFQGYAGNPAGLPLEIEKRRMTGGDPVRRWYRKMRIIYE